MATEFTLKKAQKLVDKMKEVAKTDNVVSAPSKNPYDYRGTSSTAWSPVVSVGYSYQTEEEFVAQVEETKKERHICST